MKSFFVIGFMVVCVLAHQSDENLDSNEAMEHRPADPMMPPAGAQMPKCMKNETTGCLSCSSEMSCDGENERMPTTPCPKDCKMECICMNGYARAPTGNCILEADCPKR